MLLFSFTQLQSECYHLGDPQSTGKPIDICGLLGTSTEWDGWWDGWVTEQSAYTLPG